MNKYSHKFENSVCIKCKLHSTELIWTVARNFPKEYEIWFNHPKPSTLIDFINIYGRCSMSDDEWIIKNLLE